MPAAGATQITNAVEEALRELEDTIRELKSGHDSKTSDERDLKKIEELAIAVAFKDNKAGCKRRQPKSFTFSECQDEDIINFQNKLWKLENTLHDLESDHGWKNGLKIT